MMYGDDQVRAFAKRDRAIDPYRPDEARVAGYLAQLQPGFDAGDDPVGALMASHAALVVERQVTAAAIERRIKAAVVSLGAQPQQDTPAPSELRRPQRKEPRVPRREVPSSEAQARS